MNSESPRHGLRFSLRTLFVVMTVGFVLADIGLHHLVLAIRHATDPELRRAQGIPSAEL